MRSGFLNFFNIYNKIFSSNIYIYIYILNFLIIYFIFFISTNSFLRIIIIFLFLVNSCFLLSFLGGDFFGGFLLTAELPIIVVLLIFYFQKNSLQLDSFYKYNTKFSFFNRLLPLVFFPSFTAYLYYFRSNNFFSFYNFILNDSASVSNRNDFLLLYIIYYKSNPIYIYIFALLIFFVSLLIILIFQINKIYALNISEKKQKLFLRKQNPLKQSIFKTQLTFFKKNTKL